MKILALDLGKFNSAACCFDSKTRKSKFVTVPTTRPHFESMFADCGADLVVMEACGPSGWINDLALKHGLKTIVCSTNEEAWRWANVKRKTDKDDALKLARLAAMGELKPVHTPTPEHREFRSLVKYRKTLDGRINKTKNTIRAWFVNHGITIDSGDKAWHTGRERINSFRKPIQDCGPDELWKGQLDVELTILDSLSEQITTVVKKLEASRQAAPNTQMRSIQRSLNRAWINETMQSAPNFAVRIYQKLNRIDTSNSRLINILACSLPSAVLGVTPSKLTNKGTGAQRLCRMSVAIRSASLRRS